MAIHTGTCIGRYQIHSLLGTGGIGEVYLAKLTERETPDIEADIG